MLSNIAVNPTLQLAHQCLLYVTTVGISGGLHLLVYRSAAVTDTTKIYQPIKTILDFTGSQLVAQVSVTDQGMATGSAQASLYRLDIST